MKKQREKAARMFVGFFVVLMVCPSLCMQDVVKKAPGHKNIMREIRQELGLKTPPKTRALWNAMLRVHCLKPFNQTVVQQSGLQQIVINQQGHYQQPTFFQYLSPPPHFSMNQPLLPYFVPYYFGQPPYWQGVSQSPLYFFSYEQQVNRKFNDG